MLRFFALKVHGNRFAFCDCIFVKLDAFLPSMEAAMVPNSLCEHLLLSHIVYMFGSEQAGSPSDSKKV